MRGAGLALGAALAFGVFLLALGDAGEQAGPAAVLCGRIASVAMLGAFLGGRGGLRAPVRGADAPALAVLGGLDVLANVAYAAAARSGSGGHGLATVSRARPGRRVSRAGAAFAAANPATPEAAAALAALLAAPKAAPARETLRPGLALETRLTGRTLTLKLTGDAVTPALAAEIRAILARA